MRERLEVGESDSSGGVDVENLHEERVADLRDAAGRFFASFVIDTDPAADAARMPVSDQAVESRKSRNPHRSPCRAAAQHRNGRPESSGFGPRSKSRRGKRTLEAVCVEYGIVLDAAHDALADALAAARLAAAIAGRHSKVAALGPAELHRRQIEWHAAWAADFQRRRGDAGAVVDGAWPLWQSVGETV